MSEIVYRILSLIEQVVENVPVGTNLGLVHLLLTLLSGRLLNSRGALFPALAELGLPEAAVRRAEAALCYGRWHINALLVAWQLLVLREGCWQPRSHEGYCAIPCDLVGYFRPRLGGCRSKHYHSQTEKALPAVVLGMVGAVGAVGTTRLALPRALVRAETGDASEKDLERRTLTKVGEDLGPHEVAVADAGFSLADVLLCKVARFVVRRDKNFTARRNYLPAYKGQGRHPEYGELVRPLARCYANKYHEATRPDTTSTWKVGKRTIRALIFSDLVLSDAKPGSPSFRCVVILDPKYKEPLVLATNLPISAKALWCLYSDRWPIEQLPLAAKQMLGAERSFVFGQQSRIRLPELSLLAGNILSYVAATSAPVATGFWDRCARPTCGRLRRLLGRLHFSEWPVPAGKLRKKESLTAHLPKGVAAHRRQKAGESPSQIEQRAA
jgi:hypothetical protein